MAADEHEEMFSDGEESDEEDLTDKVQHSSGKTIPLPLRTVGQAAPFLPYFLPGCSRRTLKSWAGKLVRGTENEPEIARCVE
jgi:hypothetical protein